VLLFTLTTFLSIAAKPFSVEFGVSPIQLSLPLCPKLRVCLALGNTATDIPTTFDV
jgi:hypothetical protein